MHRFEAKASISAAAGKLEEPSWQTKLKEKSMRTNGPCGLTYRPEVPSSPSVGANKGDIEGIQACRKAVLKIIESSSLGGMSTDHLVQPPTQGNRFSEKSRRFTST
ncbi:uncharacterized protein [Struthio camelus]|uniref:uncharacterized protein isoform X3 n=1 Tax=Struthio camelus TaxID=8801 RepID=UPI003603C9CC